MRLKKVYSFTLCFFVYLSCCHSAFSKPSKAQPPIQHGISFKAVDKVSDYFVSEKLDGIRGYWDGKQLLTRKGNIIVAPVWFTNDWPTLALDGELWIAREKFQALLSCVSKKQHKLKSSQACWHNVYFMMFDLPEHAGSFEQRVNMMRQITKQVNNKHLSMIRQVQLPNTDALEQKLSQIISLKGEGVILHHSKAKYLVGRNKALMKLKRFQDAEATVIAYTQGNGKYRGKMGALVVQLDNGIRFKIGSGFSDKERANPPKIGSTITFKYNGLTDVGIPRFARFWRNRTSP